MATPTFVTRTSLTIKTFGNPKKVLALPEKETRYLIGTLFGVANEVKKITRMDAKTGNPVEYEPIKGQFSAIAAEPSVEEIDGNKVSVSEYRSGTMYLPSGIHETLAEALKAPDAKPIKFAIEVYSVKANNPAGYTYECKPLIEADVADPLSEMRAALVGKTRLLPAPKGEPQGGKAKAA